MTALEKVKHIVQAMDSKHAHDIKVIRVDEVTVLADYFVIAAGTSSTQVKAIADEVEYKMSELGEEPARIEGQSPQWILIDYHDVIVHSFQQETRSFYDLERVWGDGEELDPAQFLTKE